MVDDPRGVALREGRVGDEPPVEGGAARGSTANFRLAPEGLARPRALPHAIRATGVRAAPNSRAGVVTERELVLLLHHRSSDAFGLGRHAIEPVERH
jgi:hypothetical protein